jgi:hypothetical protein
MLKNNRNLNKTAVVFGRTILTDEYNTISHVDNGTVIIKPRFDTAGLTELKVSPNNAIDLEIDIKLFILGGNTASF